MKSNPVVWFEIYVDNMERAIRFYETVLGIRLQPLSDPTDESVQMYAFPDDGARHGSGGTLVKSKDGTPGGSNVVLYFGSEDCSIEESRVEAAGGTVNQSKISLDEFGFCSIVTDTEGNRIGFHSME